MLDSPENKAKLFKVFPLLAYDIDFVITGEETPDYNCIAWAGCESKVFWQPIPGVKQPYHFDGVVHDWPYEAAKDWKLSTLQFIFSKRRYEVCVDGSYEEGYRKICFYSHTHGLVSHAARQLIGGPHHSKWTSKLGASFRITHGTPDSLVSFIKSPSGKIISYGSIIGYMRVKFDTGPIAAK